MMIRHLVWISEAQGGRDSLGTELDLKTAFYGWNGKGEPLLYDSRPNMATYCLSCTMIMAHSS